MLWLLLFLVIIVLFVKEKSFKWLVEARVFSNRDGKKMKNKKERAKLENKYTVLVYRIQYTMWCLGDVGDFGVVYDDYRISFIDIWRSLALNYGSSNIVVTQSKVLSVLEAEMLSFWYHSFLSIIMLFFLTLKHAICLYYCSIITVLLCYFPMYTFSQRKPIIITIVISLMHN